MMNKELIETEVRLATEKAPRKNTPNGPGKRLHAARTAVNIPLESAALALHLTTQMVMDLENDYYERFAGHTFIRGYLRNYARLLGLSADEIINAFNNLELIERESDKPKLALKNSCRKRSFSINKRILSLKSALLILAIVIAGWYVVKHGHFTIGRLATVNQTMPKQNVATPSPNPEAVELKQNATNAVAALTPLTVANSEQLLKTKPLDLPKAVTENAE